MKYQIALSSCRGIEPQKLEIYDSKEEAQRVVDKYNAQDNNPWAVWIVIEKKYGSQEV